MSLPILSEAQKEYLQILTPCLQKACQHPNTFNPESAYHVANAIQNVNGSENLKLKEIMNVADILGVYYQAINRGQNQGCFSSQETLNYYDSYKLLEGDIKQLTEKKETATAPIVTEEIKEPKTVEEIKEPEKISEITDEEALKIKISELEKEISALKGK